MSITFSPGKLQGQERKDILQGVQEQAKAAAAEEAEREKEGDPGGARLLAGWQARDPGLAERRQ